MQNRWGPWIVWNGELQAIKVIGSADRHAEIEFENGEQIEVNRLRLFADSDDASIFTEAFYNELRHDCDGTNPGMGDACYDKPHYTISSLVPGMPRDDRYSCIDHLSKVIRKWECELTDRIIVQVSKYEGR